MNEKQSASLMSVFGDTLLAFIAPWARRAEHWNGVGFRWLADVVCKAHFRYEESGAMACLYVDFALLIDCCSPLLGR